MANIPSAGLLLQMVEQNDDKHDKGHVRLRADLRSLEGRMDVLERAQVENKMKFARIEAMRERRSELSGYKAVILAALIGSSMRLVEVLITQGVHLLKGP